ncbi:hypothetical protein L873DRAFT_1884149 [Choiromyces venosus 120613-1]|uniref:Transposase Tc1-like domain-containing protein n=1 Tax=Choiromyces venosus 120613-1 TaxID=1336337 RepID=A0A3N4K5S5_9PEZI|nr:hypothetical protein L873DRAFT_1884149 [Choiromyces venosus 120613-1]
MPQGKSLSIAIRAAIVALHLCGQMPFKQVAVSLHINKKTVYQVYRKVEERSRSPRIKDMLTAVDQGNGVYEKPAVPQKHPRGSEGSERLKQRAVKDEEHHQRTFPKITREAGIKIAHSTVYKLMHEHHNLYRYRYQSKPSLDFQGKLDRL